jgi:hypothetical protein
MADIVFSFALSSPRDIAAAAGEMPLPLPDRIATLSQYHCLYHTREDGRVVELDAARKIVADLNPLYAKACADS